MKKIVGIIAAFAMAASVFAVDVGSELQIDGNLFSYDKTTGVKALMVKQYDPSGSSDYLWKLSVSGDNAGAEIWSWKDDGSVSSKTLWFKPVDSLKVSLGDITVYSCWNPQFGWWAKNLAFEQYGAKVEYTVDSLTIEAAIGAGAGNYLFNTKADATEAKDADGNKIKDADGNTTYEYKDNEGYDKINPFIVSAKYALSAGTAQVWVGKGAGVHPHGFTGWGSSPLAFGAVWGNCPYMQNGYFIDVAGAFSYKDWKDTSWAKNDGFKFDKVVAQVYGQYFINGFGAQIIAVGGYQTAHTACENHKKNDKDNWILVSYDATPLYGFEAKFQYPIDKYTPYLQIGGYEIADKKLTIDAGVTTSVGACSITAYADFPLDFNEGASFSFSVPVEFTINL